MIRGVGSDIVDIHRFISWRKFSREKLLRIFTEGELAYCMDAQGVYMLEKLAARFAAKEACYKALSSFFSLQIPPFLTLAPLIEVCNNQQGRPSLRVAWQVIADKAGITINVAPVTHVSLSHEKAYALAFVVVETLP